MRVKLSLPREENNMVEGDLAQNAERKPGLHREEVTGSCRELRNKQLHYLFCLHVCLITTLQSEPKLVIL